MTESAPGTISKILKIAALGGIAAGAIIALWLTGYVLFALNSLNIRQDDPQRITDAVIVLTGDDQRIEEGLALYAGGRTAHLFITGVYPGVSTRSIKALWQGETALPPCCLTLGHKATTTIQNAQEAREWMIEHGYTLVRLVTSEYHMPRAMTEFKHALPGIEIIRHAVELKPYKPFTRTFWRLSFLEYHKTLWRKAILFFTPREPLPFEDNEIPVHSAANIEISGEDMP